MLNEETKRKLGLLKIHEFVDAAEEQERDPDTLALDFDARFQRMVDEVYQRKYNAKVLKTLKTAKLRFPQADIHDLFYDKGRPVKRELIEGLASGRYLEDNKSIIIHGFAGSGKTYLGCSLAKEACRLMYRTKYLWMPDLMMEYDEKSLEPGGIKKMLAKYANFKVLVLDEWLTQEMSPEELDFIFELTERRYDTTSTIFCTLYDTSDWVVRMKEGSKAESITERFTHDAIKIYTGDMNMREKYTNTGKPRC